jgi:hypothetical protein
VSYASKPRFVELCGRVTDRTRKMLLGMGWNHDRYGFYWQDPLTDKWFTEPVATAIMLKRVDRARNPEKWL